MFTVYQLARLSRQREMFTFLFPRMPGMAEFRASKVSLRVQCLMSARYFQIDATVSIKVMID